MTTPCKHIAGKSVPLLVCYRTLVRKLIGSTKLRLWYRLHADLAVTGHAQAYTQQHTQSQQPIIFHTKVLSQSKAMCRTHVAILSKQIDTPLIFSAGYFLRAVLYALESVHCSASTPPLHSAPFARGPHNCSHTVSQQPHISSSLRYHHRPSKSITTHTYTTLLAVRYTLSREASRLDMHNSLSTDRTKTATFFENIFSRR